MQIKQECIPVGCVPPAAVAVRWGSPPCNPPPSPRPDPPPTTRQPPGTRHPLGPDPQDQAPPGTRHPPPVDRHTPVNILPCPKLRLRPVIIILRLKTLRAHWMSYPEDRTRFVFFLYAWMCVWLTMSTIFEFTYFVSDTNDVFTLCGTEIGIWTSNNGLYETMWLHITS